MTQAPPSRQTRLRIFWEAADAVMARRGLPPLSFEAAVDWFESELEPEAVGDLLDRVTSPRKSEPPGGLKLHAADEAAQ